MTTSIHTDRMKEHLIGQFESKKVLYAEIEALGAELDILHQVWEDLINKRWIDTGSGAQLDGIGTIVNRARQIDDAIQIDFFGFYGQENAKTFDVGQFRNDNENYLSSTNLNDSQYRKILWLKVFKDVSSGVADDTIYSLSRIFDTKYIVLSEIGNAKIMIGIGRELTDNEIHFAKAVNLIIKAAGVGVHSMENYDYSNYFGFKDQTNAKGFDVGSFADEIDILF